MEILWKSLQSQLTKAAALGWPRFEQGETLEHGVLVSQGVKNIKNLESPERSVPSSQVGDRQLNCTFFQANLAFYPPLFVSICEASG